jgi:hypothetical protein
VTAEEVLLVSLTRRIGSLVPGVRHKIVLEQIVSDGVGGWKPPPHPVGWVERRTPGGVQVRLVDTEAGRTAAALLEEELLDVVLSRDYPPTIRLT